ncbi:hypothetical protein GWK47_000673 [Chionoecetes opilio]|uniref:Uncharacterized protein n=1 Tax=Chionoecetes opilio TaxID=41210 RepID=A0A8J4YD96_CHIOP|nr:hypothetical protein GWK47_000673 [Chionoecetes opilio]
MSNEEGSVPEGGDSPHSSPTDLLSLTRQHLQNSGETDGWPHDQHTHGAIRSEPDDLSDLKTKHCLVASDQLSVGRTDQNHPTHDPIWLDPTRSVRWSYDQIAPMCAATDHNLTQD